MSFLSAIGAIGSVASGLLGGIFNASSQQSANEANLRAVRETNKANRELAQYNWEQQVKMWNDQNAYNSPSAQMSRLRDAGLNPHLVYGNGVTGNNAGQTPTPQLAHMEAARVEPVNYGQGLATGIEQGVAAYFNAQRLKNESELAQSQVTSQSVENRLRLAQMMVEFSKNRGLEIDNSQKTKLFNYTLRGAEQELIRQQNQNSIFDMQMSNLALEMELKRDAHWMSLAQIQNVIKTKDLISANIARAYSDISLNNLKKSELNEIIRGLGLENRFKDATFDDRVNMVSTELSKLISTSHLTREQLEYFAKFGNDPSGEVGNIWNVIHTLIRASTYGHQY